MSSAEYSQSRRKRLKLRCICLDCGKKAAQDRTRCRVCLEKHMEQHHSRKLFHQLPPWHLITEAEQDELQRLHRIANMVAR